MKVGYWTVIIIRLGLLRVVVPKNSTCFDCIKRSNSSHADNDTTEIYFAKADTSWVRSASRTAAMYEARCCGVAQRESVKGNPQRCNTQLTSIRPKRPLPSVNGCIPTKPRDIAAALTAGSKLSRAYRNGMYERE